MVELKNAFYEVMYEYEKSFSEEGVMANLRAWAEAKAPLLELLRRHPNWSEADKAVVIAFHEGRGIDRNVVDEIAFHMRMIVEEAVAADMRGVFRDAFDAAIAEYSQTLSENTLELIRQRANIKCAVGQKTSRIIGKLCHQYGVDAHDRYNQVFAQLSDALNPVEISKTAVLSVHPCDFLEMSDKKNTWRSCHNLTKGLYQSGTLSYMTDSVSMIFFTVDPDVTSTFYRVPKRTRQIFFYQDNCLYQSRLYPADGDDYMEQNRSIVHKIIATCLEVPNLWVLKTKRDELQCFNTAEGSAHYPDYLYHGNLSYIKGTVVIPKMTIGKRSLCVCCGMPYYERASLKCGCAETVVCQDCGQTVPRRLTRYAEGAFHCNACWHICSVCGRIIHDTMYPALNRKGLPIEVCRDCFEHSMEPCFACSVRGICGIIGNSLCQHVSIRMAPAEVV